MLNKMLKNSASQSGRRSRLGIRAQLLRGPAVGVVIAGLTMFLGFNAGGFFPGSTAIAALVRLPLDGARSDARLKAV